MSMGLAQLPFDIVHYIARQLDVRSFDSLSKTSRSLNSHLRNENTAKHAIQAWPHNSWVQQASHSPQPSFRQTLDRLVKCQDSLQQACPYSACIIAYASTFAYLSGIVCYVSGGNLRILNLNDQRATEKVIDASVFTNHVSVLAQAVRHVDFESLGNLQILGYAYDIVALLCDFGSLGRYVFAIDIADEPPESPPLDGSHPRVKLCVPTIASSKLFTQHDSQFLVLGTLSALGSNQHHEWLLYIFDLETSEPVSAEPLQLEDFHGSEIGSTVCFSIYDGYFYAVTNQTSSMSEEVDWTSYYHLIHFRLDEPQTDLEIKVIWRRQHLEGPINDAWTDLGFQVDQSTGELLIVESRKEWVGGGSRSIRTYYTQPVQRAQLKNLKEGLRHPPTADRLIRTLDENSNSRYEDPHTRVERYVHAEYPASNEKHAKEYIRAKTKWNGYSFNTQSFVDLVADEVIPEGEWRPRQFIRLRVASRQELCPLVGFHCPASPESVIIRPRARDDDGNEMEDSERAFSQSHIYLWPPDDAPQELHDLMCPQGRAGDVKAVLGNEGLVYIAGPPQASSIERALVFISFDPTFGFSGMKRLDGTSARMKRDGKRKNASCEQISEDISTCANQSELEGSRPLDRRKRRKTDLEQEKSTMVLSDFIPAKEQLLRDMSSPLQGDATTQVPGPDPPSSPALRIGLPTRHLSPLSRAIPTTDEQSPQPDSPTLQSSLARPSAIKDEANGKGKARANMPPSTLLTRREKAMYISIGKGFWLR